MEDTNKITEAVDVDARTGMFRRTLTRLEQARAMRESKTNKYQGMYDDGSGKGVIMPKPISFNKENRRFTVEIDGRTKGLREAMKRVEMYRKLREDKKKKTIMGGWKEEVEITEASSYADSLLDAVEKAYNKGGLRAVIGGAQVFKLDTDTTVDDVLQDMKAIFGNDKKYAATEVKGFLKPQDYAKYKSMMESWSEEVEVNEETIAEATTLTKGQILDAVGMKGNKFEVNEEELSSKQKKYRAFFQSALKKFGKNSPAAMNDAEKKKFFSYVKSNWKG